MHRLVILFLLMLATQAYAELQPRCATDAFGNTVCMDKDGVLTTTPATDSDGKDGTGAASSVTADDSKQEGREVRRRCSVDPFGNNVCREW